MQSLVQEIQSSLLEIFGQGVEFIPALIAALIILALTRYGANATRHLTYSAAARLLHNPSLQTLAVQIAYVTAWITGILIAAVVAFPDLGLGDLIALLGLGSVAIGFAFQDIFKNFLAGIILLLQQPFRIGDQILVEGYEGTVEEIALRSTQIRTYQGEEVVIPNAIMFTGTVQVQTALPHRRTDLDIGLDYNTPLAEAAQVLLKAARAVEGVKADPEPEVDITEFGDSAINFVVRYWTDPQQVNVRRIKTQVIIALKQACDQADYNIPYPIRTVYYFDQEKYSDSDRMDGATKGNGVHQYQD